MTEARELHGSALAESLRDCRRRTLAWTGDLTDEQWAVPQRQGINPVAWELAHLAWFAEFWTLRGPHHADAQDRPQPSRPPVHAGPDAVLDSSRIPHAERWKLSLPRARVLSMLDAQLEASVAALPPGRDGDALYFHRLALFHEDMHGEAFAWLRSTLGYPAPTGVELHRLPAPARLCVRGGEVGLGGARGAGGFAFDNELPGCGVLLADFEIDSAPVTAGQFLEFVESGGYDDPAYWPDEAGRWRAQANRSQPERWRRAGGGRASGQWEQRWFDRWRPLDPSQPVIHVNAFEAQAYCHWAGCHLPNAAQWEHAARSHPRREAGDGTEGFAWGGTVWEWTADAFEPYPGFIPGPYRDYSAPWFGNHRELRGGAFATHPRLHDPGYRNFFMPHRNDVFAGFRTVARQD